MEDVWLSILLEVRDVVLYSFCVREFSSRTARSPTNDNHQHSHRLKGNSGGREELKTTLHYIEQAVVDK